MDVLELLDYMTQADFVSKQKEAIREHAFKQQQPNPLEKTNKATLALQEGKVLNYADENSEEEEKDKIPAGEQNILLQNPKNKKDMSEKKREGGQATLAMLLEMAHSRPPADLPVAEMVEHIRKPKKAVKIRKPRKKTQGQIGLIEQDKLEKKQKNKKRKKMD